MDPIHALIKVALDFYHQHQFLGLFLMILIEEAGIPIPIPGDALIVIAGLEPHRGPLYAIHVIAVSSTAVFLGSSLLYLVSRKGGRPFFRRYGRYILLDEPRLAKTEGWFTRWGRLAIIFGRLIPGLRIPTTIMAGISAVPPATYFPTAAVAGVIWSAVFFFLGALVEHEIRYVAAFVVGALDLLSDSVVSAWVLIALLAAAVGALHVAQIRRRRKDERHGRATTAPADAHGDPSGPLAVAEPQPKVSQRPSEAGASDDDRGAAAGEAPAEQESPLHPTRGR